MLLTLWLSLVLSLAVRAAPAHAQSDDPEPARPIRLDLVRGPLITSSRITGLGGAYAGVAVGIDGVWRNPATLANRDADASDWFDYDVTFDFLVVDGDQVDFDGDGLRPGGDRQFTAVNLGLSLQLDTLAVGVLAALYGYAGGDNASDVSYVDVLLGVAYAIDGGLLIVGGGMQTSLVGITTAAIQAGESVEIKGQALDVGVLFRPRDAAWRLGGRVRFGAELASDEPASADKDQVTAALPWQLGLGWSLLAAGDPARRYNARLRSPPPTLLDRRYLLLSAEVVVMGATDGESLEALAAGQTKPSGRAVTTSLHLGAEGEVFDDLMRARVGTYFEPGRVLGAPAGRLHVTGGVELKLFQFIWMWKATFGFDLAPGWENVSFGVGFWK